MAFGSAKNDIRRTILELVAPPKEPGVSMTLKKWGHYPKLRGHGPIF